MKCSEDLIDSYKIIKTRENSSLGGGGTKNSASWFCYYDKVRIRLQNGVLDRSK